MSWYVPDQDWEMSPGHRIKTVEARSLYEFLVPGGTHYHRWVTRFTENPEYRRGIDWVEILPAHAEETLQLTPELQNLSDARGGHNRLGYRVSTWLTERLGLMQQSRRGDQIRNYFIACRDEFLRIAASRTTTPQAALPENVSPDLANKLLAAIEQSNQLAESASRELIVVKDRLEVVQTEKTELFATLNSHVQQAAYFYDCCQDTSATMRIKDTAANLNVYYVPDREGEVSPSYHVKTISARDLYEFLVPGGQHFYRWVTRFTENPEYRRGIDWVEILPAHAEGVFLIREENPSSCAAGGRPSTEYRVSLWLAERLGMLQESRRGSQIRNYFVDCRDELRRTPWHRSYQI